MNEQSQALSTYVDQIIITCTLSIKNALFVYSSTHGSGQLKDLAPGRRIFATITKLGAYLGNGQFKIWEKKAWLFIA
jgi:hypothetical protein